MGISLRTAPQAGEGRKEAEETRETEEGLEVGGSAIIAGKVGISQGIVIKGKRGIGMTGGKIGSAINAKSLDILQESVLFQDSN